MDERFSIVVHTPNLDSEYDFLYFGRRTIHPTIRLFDTQGESRRDILKHLSLKDVRELYSSLGEAVTEAEWWLDKNKDKIKSITDKYEKKE